MNWFSLTKGSSYVCEWHKLTMKPFGNLTRIEPIKKVGLVFIDNLIIYVLPSFNFKVTVKF